MLKRSLALDDVYRRGFAREARIAQDVRHRHLVPVVAAGEIAGYHFLASEYVEGGSLDDALQQRRALTVRETTAYAAGIAAGLDALHEREIVHRDVKPANVMLRPGGPALTDFGLARGSAFTVLTEPGQALGTLDYIAPEVIRGEHATPASDVYSLGCLVHECLTGAPPFADRSVFEIAVAHLEEEPPDVRGRRPDAPEGFAWAVRTALAKDPARRPQTATAYAHLLRAGG